jgi:hypothetical protein
MRPPAKSGQAFVPSPGRFTSGVYTVTQPGKFTNTNYAAVLPRFGPPPIRPVL